MNIGTGGYGPLFPIPLSAAMITTKSRDRFFKKVEKAEGGCWLWLAGKSPGGYGKFSVCRMTVAAHRFSYLIAHGEISSLTIDHLCRNRACVNPVHLEQVPIRENILRGEGLAAINARKDSCDREHPFNEKNLRVSPNGHGGTYRACRKCEAIDMKKSRASNPNIKTYLNDYSQGYREAHREELRASAKKRYYEQREQMLVRAAEYRKKNRERIIIYLRGYRQRLREERSTL